MNIILGIESSCDETAAAIYHQEKGIIAHALFSQIALHKEFGGVIPEIASRSHLEKINSIVQEVLNRAKITLDDITTIAVTSKPGLPGSLLVGVSFAKALALARTIPIIGVNHLEGHVFSACIENNVPFPHLCITASGGHTSMYIVHDFGKYELLGETLDDAAGEAFDKISKLLNLGYPGGPIIEKLASEVAFEDFFHYTRGNSKTTDFSFSGLKTAVLYDLVARGAYDMKAKKFLKEDDLHFKQQVASSLLVAITEIFKNKISLALKVHPEIKAVTFVGGVACNKYIKRELTQLAQKLNVTFFTPSPTYCTDNGAMIAFVGNYMAEKRQFSDLTLDILK